MQIMAITPEQEARFAEWRDKWIKIGLSTEPADFDRAEKAALKAYVLCKLERPKIILRMGSPYSATVGGALARFAIRQASGINWELSNVFQQVGMQVGHQVWQQAGLQVETQIDQQVWRQVWQRVWRRVALQVGYPVCQRLEHQVEQQVWQQAWRKLEQQIRQQAWRKLEQPIGRQVEQKLRWHPYQQAIIGVAKEGFHNKRGGVVWAPWCAYVTFLRDVLGLRDPIFENFSIDEDLVTSCNWVWWNKDVLAISDRPSEIHLDAEGRLHNESGPSIAYRDGWKLYHVHGVAVPDFVVERPDKIRIEHIANEGNAEVRRIMVSRMGIERFIRESGLKPIHSDDFGTLYRKEMPDDEPLVVVKVVNSTPNPDGSCKEYFLRVPPTMKRAREAVAWTFGMKEKEYRPATET